jgi:hypothetical protein
VRPPPTGWLDIALITSSACGPGSLNAYTIERIS